MAPTLTVVIIVYNDASRLPRAVRSVARQTLSARSGAGLEIVIVDDASTDSTQQVAERLAAADPERIRYHRLAQNSGGCSAPRNAGIDVATGRYVMFLDSDDELPPSACAALVKAVEDSGADFAAGLCMRRHLNRGSLLTAWYSWLFTERTVLSSILDNPDLLYDTLSTNKCYRREFLVANDLRFPVGYHYEDLLFSAQVYLHATRIALIPDLVYYWDVVDATDTPSISNRRHELSNFRDRILIHTKIDEAFADRGAVELKLHKDVKFLRHDLRLYIAELPFRDPAFRREFLELARDYLRTLDRRAYSRVEPAQAIVGYLIEQGDEDNLFTAIDWIAHGRKLSTRLHLEGDRVFWCAAHLDSDEGRAVLDVTDLNLHDKPLAQLDLYNRIVELSADGPVLALSGVILNQLGRIDAGADLRMELVLRTRRGGRRAHHVPVTDLRRDGAGDLAWSARIDLREAMRAVGFVDRVWDLRAHLHVDAVRNVSRLSTRDSDMNGVELPVRPAAGRMAADHVETLVTPDGDLALQFVPTGRLARSIHERGRRVAESVATRRAKDLARRVRKAVRQPGHPRLREELFRRTLLRLPASPRLVFFESAGGARAAGNPRAVYDELRRRGADFDAVWASAPGRRGGDRSGFPSDARTVRHGSLAYFRALARARVWVDDRGVPREAAKRTGTTYIQTFDGTPLKWVGFDAAAMRRATNADRLALRKRVDKWDAVVVRSGYERSVVPQAFRSRAEVLAVGYPRCDVLVTATEEDRAKARAEAGVTGEQQVVLYLGACTRSLVPDQQMLAPDQTLLTATSGPDLTTLLLAADVLVTQHHPAMFEFPLLRRPMVFVGCTCPARPRRGSKAETYFDLDAAAPGPVVWSAEELRSALADVDALYTAHATRLDDWLRTYATYDDGRASSAVADAVVRGLGG
jgi:CDP-glycerol glycerophosphotransferase